MSSEESDVEMRSALPKKPMKAAPKSPTSSLLDQQEATKKLSTKDMIYEALKNLKSRKGASLYAIKKFMQERFNVDTEKINHIIKRTLKTGVEMGVIVQTKGTGASGSFKLGIIKKVETKKKTNTEKPYKKDENSEKSAKSNVEKPKKAAKKTEKEYKENVPRKVQITKGYKTDKTAKASKTEKDVKSKGGKTTKTPKKKANMMRRKSIGSIIKPPKMKPKAKA